MSIEGCKCPAQNVTPLTIQLPLLTDQRVGEGQRERSATLGGCVTVKVVIFALLVLCKIGGLASLVVGPHPQQLKDSRKCTRRLAATLLQQYCPLYHIYILHLLQLANYNVLSHLYELFYFIHYNFSFIFFVEI